MAGEEREAMTRREAKEFLRWLVLFAFVLAVTAIMDGTCGMHAGAVR